MAASFIFGMLGKGLVTAGKTAWGAAKAVPGLARFGKEASLFAARHPYMTLGGIGGAAYLSSDTTTGRSPSLDNPDVMSMNIQAENKMIETMNTAVAPTGSLTSGAAVRNQRFMESTMGLVQGMWSSRH